MSVVQGDTGAELIAIGGGVVTVGATITAFANTLPDSVPGSPRDVGTAVGMAVAAVGAALMSIGAFVHARFHKAQNMEALVEKLSKKFGPASK